jgi:hypothetical protein
MSHCGGHDDLCHQRRNECTAALVARRMLSSAEDLALDREQRADAPPLRGPRQIARLVPGGSLLYHQSVRPPEAAFSPLKSLEEALNVVEMALLDVPAGLQQIAENRRAHTTTLAQVGQILHAR